MSLKICRRCPEHKLFPKIQSDWCISVACQMSSCVKYDKYLYKIDRSSLSDNSTLLSCLSHWNRKITNNE